jgi:predicted phage tail protein
VLLYGELRRKYGKRHTYAIRTPAEALRALEANFPGFANDLIRAAQNNVGFRVFVGRDPLASETELSHPSGREVVKIVPTPMGADGFGEILGGLALIVGAAIFPGIAAVGLIGTMTIGGVATAVGLGMALGGVAQLLASDPKTTQSADRPENRPSYQINGPVNSVAQGNPVPVLYGRMLVGGQLISAGITTDAIPA